MLLSPMLRIERSKEPISALKNPSTSNPGETNPANIKSKALITSVNRPRVRIFIGRVTRTRNGLMKTLISAITMATMSALQNVSTEIPGITQAINIIARAKPIQRKNKYIIILLIFCG